MLKEKGMYVWKIKNCEGGIISDIVTMCVNAGFSHVLIKIADGTQGYNFTQEDGDMAKALADALKAVGIEPWGWQYLYGNDPVREAETATRRMKETGCVGFIIDAEGEIRDALNNDLIIENYFDTLTDDNIWLEIPIALASYRYPEVHPKFPWETFLLFLHKSHGDFIMPQLYWMEAHNPAEQLRECLRQYAKITDLPILPTGSAFCEHGWCATNEDIIEFADEAKAQGLLGINFWEWAVTRAGGFWKTVRDIEYTVEEPPMPPEEDCCVELEERFELHTEYVEQTQQAQQNLIRGNTDRIDGIDKILSSVDGELNDCAADMNRITGEIINLATDLANLDQKTVDQTNILLQSDESLFNRIKMLDERVLTQAHEITDLKEEVRVNYGFNHLSLGDLQEQIDNITIPETNHSHRKIFSWLFNKK